MKLPIRYNLRSVLARRTRTSLTAAGVALTVFAATSMIALSRGLIESTLGSASPENVIVLSQGAEGMEFSAIDPQILHRLKNSPHIQTEEGEPLASPECYISSFVRFPGKGDNDHRGVVRGVWPVAFKVHEQVRLIAGTPPERGFSVVVGRLAATKLGAHESDLAIGKTMEFEGQTWTVSGIFEAPGTTLESEIWGHLDDVLTASKRTDYSSVSLKAAGQAAREELLFDLVTRTDIRVDAKTEAVFYEGAAKALSPVRAVAVAMTALLVAGAVMAGMNTMFASILGRTREMAVLIVLGYRRASVLASFVLESLLISCAGGLLGAGSAWFLNDFPMKIPMGAFRFVVDGWTLGIGMGLACGIGVAGSVVPVLRVSRMHSVDALRGA